MASERCEHVSTRGHPCARSTGHAGRHMPAMRGTPRPTLRKCAERGHEPPASGKCMVCRSATQDAHIANGLCQNGDGRPLASKRYCQSCLDYKSAARDAHVANGLCRSGDGMPLDSERYCQSCLDRASAARDAHVANGLCSTGDGMPLDSFSSVYCSSHEVSRAVARF